MKLQQLHIKRIKFHLATISQLFHDRRSKITAGFLALGAIVTLGFENCGMNGNGFETIGDVNKISASSVINQNTFQYASASMQFTATLPVYSIKPSITGGNFNSFKVSPNLPSGMFLDSKTGIISGIPSQAQPIKKYTITGQGSNSFSVDIQIAIIGFPVTFTYGSTSMALPANSAMASLSPINVSGGPLSFSVAPNLPTGLTLSSTTGAISGTPTMLQAASLYKVSAVNSTGGAQTVNLTIGVIKTPVNFAYSSAAVSVVANSVFANLTPMNVVGAPNNFSVTPSLPAGLSLNATTGVISGTPTTAQVATAYNITGMNLSGGSATLSLNITVTTIPVSFAYGTTAVSLPVNSLFSTLTPTTVVGAPSSYSVSPNLPAGLNLNSSTGVISGTPSTVQASSKYSITATNPSGGSYSVDLNIAVTSIPVSFAYTSTNISVAVNSVFPTLTPSNLSGAPTNFRVSPSLPVGLVLNNANGVVSGTPTLAQASVKYSITGSNTSGGSFIFDINIAVIIVPVDFSYSSNTSFTVTAGSAFPTLTPTIRGAAISSFSVSPSFPSGINLDARTGVISGTALTAQAATKYSVKAVNASGGSLTVDLFITITSIPVTFAYGTTAVTGLVNSPFTSLIPTGVTGAPTAFRVSPTLPSGMALDSASGVISGTPTAAISATNFNITAVNASGGSLTVVLNIEVKTIPVNFAYRSSAISFPAFDSISNLNPLNVSGNPTNFSVTPNLPFGISLDSATGVISGAPTIQQAAANYSVTGNNSNGGSFTFILSISIVVIPVDFAYAAGAAISVVVNSPLANIMPDSLSGDPNSFLVSPALPLGISLDPSSGLLSGTPTEVRASQTYSITARNKSGGSKTSSIQIAVTQIPLQITYYSNSFVFQINAPSVYLGPSIGGGTPALFEVSPALPAGLQLDPNSGVISGNPTTVTATADYTITASANPVSWGKTSVILKIAITEQAPRFDYMSGIVNGTVGVSIGIVAPTNFMMGGSITNCTSDRALPGGLSLSPNCVISGTPTTEQMMRPYMITGSNSGGNGMAMISIVISRANLPLKISSLSVSNGAMCAVLNGQVRCTYFFAGGLQVYDKLDGLSNVQQVSVSPKDNSNGAPFSSLVFALAGGAVYQLSPAPYCDNSDFNLTDAPQINSPSNFSGYLTSSWCKLSGWTSGVSKITSGQGYICAIHGGAAECAGANSRGQLGIGGPYGVPGPRMNSPMPVLGLSYGVQDISASKFTTCAVANGQEMCWGDNYYSIFGFDPDFASCDAARNCFSNVPVAVQGMGAGISFAALGANSNCSSAYGNVTCTGQNWNGELGDPALAKGFGCNPTQNYQWTVGHTCKGTANVVGLQPGNVIGFSGTSYTNSISSPDSFAIDTRCAIMGTNPLATAGVLQCWGYNGMNGGSFGKLGLQSVLSNDDMYGIGGSAMPSTPMGFTQISSAVQIGDSMLAVESNSQGDKIWVWGGGASPTALNISQ